MRPLTSATIVEVKMLWSYTQPSTQGSVSRSVMLGKVLFRLRSCHWGRLKRRHFSGLRFESSGMEILRRASGLRVPVSLAESVSLSKMWTQQRWSGMAAVKFSSRMWGYTMRLEIQKKTIWRIWNLPRPPTWSRRSWKAIKAEQVVLKRRQNDYLEKLKGKNISSCNVTLSVCWSWPHFLLNWLFHQDSGSCFSVLF